MAPAVVGKSSSAPRRRRDSASASRTFLADLIESTPVVRETTVRPLQLWIALCQEFLTRAANLHVSAITSYGVTSSASTTTMVLVDAAVLVPVGLIWMVCVPAESAEDSQILQRQPMVAE